eukprot:13349-Rhodomonas_salina.1
MSSHTQLSCEVIPSPNVWAKSGHAKQSLVPPELFPAGTWCKLRRRRECTPFLDRRSGRLAVPGYR